ncbi:MAG TPA: methyltransferase domain-containing protein [Nitrososphaera sp.]|nr:methyltransferase domain-containing protein [Nitrososphaera sp.]
MTPDYDPIEYKISSIQNWNTIARVYHEDWASKGRGPFGSIAKLVEAADIQPSDAVLDVACGTGAVSMEASLHLGSSGLLVAIDFSRGALEIARSYVPSGHFFEMDAEHIGLATRFDKILCHYALMFFPDPASVLRQLYELLRKGGRLAVAVHGTPAGVPYFSTIMEPVLRYIPDIRPKGAPTVHRFGNQVDLREIVADVGFSDISIREFTFNYEAGSFETYWSDYMSTTASSIRDAIERKGPSVVAQIKAEAERRASFFIRNHDNKIICFPWQVLIATAIRA